MYLCRSLKSPALLAKQIELAASHHTPPFFLVAHGSRAVGALKDFPTFLKRTMDFLDPEKYEAVTLGKMMALAKLKGEEVKKNR